jgi:hypothetical protein
MNETGLNEESETENVEPTTSRLINQDIESDEEMNDTMILRPQRRHKTLRSSTRIFVLPRDLPVKAGNLAMAVWLLFLCFGLTI